MYEAQTGVYKVVIMDYLPKEFLYKKCMCAKSLQSCLTLYDPMDCIKETTSNFIFTSIPRLPGRNHQGDCETEIRLSTLYHISCSLCVCGGGWHKGDLLCVFFREMESSGHAQCLTCCDLMDCSPPGSSVHGIFQARVLEWVAVPCSRRSS